MSLVPMQTPFFDPKQEAEVKRRRRMAQAMQKAGEQPTSTEMVSGMAVKQSPLAGLARMGSAIMGGYQDSKADTAEADIAKRRQEMIAQAISQYKDNPQETVSILAQDPSTADSAFAILKDLPRGDGQFTGNSIEAQMANRLLKDPTDQIANMYYTKLVTLPGGGVAAISPLGRGFNPQGVPDGNPAPAAPVQPPTQLPPSGSGQSPFNDILNTLGGQNPAAASGIPLDGNPAAKNESLPLPNPSQFAQAAQAQVRGANGVNTLIQPKPDDADIDTSQQDAELARRLGVPYNPLNTRGLTGTQRAMLIRRSQEGADKVISGDDFRGALNTARQNDSYAKQFEDLMKNQSTGGVYAAPFGIGAIARTVGRGFDPETSQMAQIVDKLTPSQRVAGSGATSDFDAKMFQNALFGIDKPEAANSAIIAGIRAQSKNEIERQAFMSDYAQANGTLTGAEKYWQDYLNNNPIFDPNSPGNPVINKSRLSYSDYFNGGGQTAAAPQNVQQGGGSGVVRWEDLP